MNPVDNICTHQTVFNTKNKEFKKSLGIWLRWTLDLIFMSLKNWIVQSQCSDPDKWRTRSDVSTRWARTDLQLVFNYQPS